jgi:hypothetical protein
MKTMENLTTLDLQIILDALKKMPESNSEVINKHTKSLINDFQTLLLFRLNREYRD